jgi:hypothetical protein
MILIVGTTVGHFKRWKLYKVVSDLLELRCKLENHMPQLINEVIEAFLFEQFTNEWGWRDDYAYKYKK